MMKNNKNDELEKLARILLEERVQKNLGVRNEKVKQILLLLAGGAALATGIVAPGTAKLFRYFLPKDSQWKDWKLFNINYLRRTLRRLEKEKLIEIKDNGKFGEVRLTKDGERKILQMNVEEMTIVKPVKWDGRWRMVFYDVLDGKKGLRDKFRRCLLSAGFFPWQESVYLHAYPCEKEIEFLRSFLGISGQVRIIVADEWGLTYKTLVRIEG